ncbi:MAG: WYL domain-containing protein [Endomicrobium sp.]|jgi:predicted DNA-binding transcriptional regulator YafY|nr:WYL domain-containing protein [Endomicrobium sp.]
MLEETLTKINRLMYLLNELNGGKIRLSAVALQLNVAVRTIQRDIIMLEKAGFLIAQLEKGVYAFMEGFSLQKMQLNQKEAAMLALFSDVANALGDNFTGAYESLLKRILQIPADNPFYVKIHKGNRYVANEITKAIEKAVNEREKIYITYEGGKANSAPVCPLKIVWFDGYWYLLALGHRGTLLKLRLEKIKHAQSSGKYFKRPANFERSLDDGTSIWFERKRDKKIVLNISQYASKYFKDKKHFPKQKAVKSLKNGSSIIECFANKYEEIIPTILSWIPHITVNTPKELSNIIEEKIKIYLNTAKGGK